MKKYFRNYLLPAMVPVLLISCKTGDDKTKQMATDMCNCFKQLNDSIPPEVNAVFLRLAVMENIKDNYAAEMEKLSADARVKLNNALLSTSQAGSPVKDCLEEMDKKYKTVGGKEAEMNRKMAEAVKGQQGCEMMATLMRLQAEKLGN